jgi:hypothetical protein
MLMMIPGQKILNIGNKESSKLKMNCSIMKRWHHKLRRNYKTKLLNKQELKKSKELLWKKPSWPNRKRDNGDSNLPKKHSRKLKENGMTPTTSLSSTKNC